MKKEIIIKDYRKSVVDRNDLFKIEDILNNYYMRIENVKNFHTIREILPIIYVIAETYEYIIDKTKWDRIIFQYMERIRNQIIEEGYSNRLSLFDGMSEIGLAVKLLNKKTGYYSNFLKNINNHILLNLQTLARVKIENISNLRMQDFDCISGISGIISYLLHMGKCVDLNSKGIYDSISYLISLGDYDISGKYKLPRWHIKAKNQSREDEKYRFPQGHYNFSLSHGIAGVLVALSFATINGIELTGQKKCIERILAEYKRLVIIKEDITYWPGQYSYENYILGERMYDDVIKRMSWCYGSIGILRAMKIGAQATADEELKYWVNKNIYSISTMKIEDYGFNSPILCHGYTGLLALLVVELREKKTVVIQKKVHELTQTILEFFCIFRPRRALCTEV